MSVYEKEDTLVEQGASTRILKEFEGEEKENVLLGNVIKEFTGVRTGVIKVAVFVN